MKQGFALVMVLVVVFVFSGLGGIGYSLYKNSKKTVPQPILEEQNIETSDSNIQEDEILNQIDQNTATPTITPKPTSTPTSTPKPAQSKYSCTVNTTFESDGMAPKLYYGVVNNTSGASMTAARWDFDGNGSWDTDLNILNGTLTHKFDTAGTYNVKLQLQMSDGGFTNICNKLITVPQASEYYQATFSGKVFRDENCNNVWDTNEQFLSGISVSFYKIPEWYTQGSATSDSGGNYSFSTKVKNGETLTLRPSTVAPSGYKIRYDMPNLTASSSNPNPSATMSLVPYESVGNCP